MQPAAQTATQHVEVPRPETGVFGKFSIYNKGTQHVHVRDAFGEEHRLPNTVTNNSLRGTGGVDIFYSVTVGNLYQDKNNQYPEQEEVYRIHLSHKDLAEGPIYVKQINMLVMLNHHSGTARHPHERPDFDHVFRDAVERMCDRLDGDSIRIVANDPTGTLPNRIYAMIEGLTFELSVTSYRQTKSGISIVLGNSEHGEQPRMYHISFKDKEGDDRLGILSHKGRPFFVAKDEKTLCALVSQFNEEMAGKRNTELAAQIGERTVAMDEQVAKLEQALATEKKHRKIDEGAALTKQRELNQTIVDKDYELHKIKAQLATYEGERDAALERVKAESESIKATEGARKAEYSSENERLKFYASATKVIVPAILIVAAYYSGGKSNDIVAGAARGAVPNMEVGIIPAVRTMSSLSIFSVGRTLWRKWA